MGLKSMIRDKIPQPWLHVLQENKAVTEYVDLVYRTHCIAKKGKPNIDILKGNMMRINRALKESSITGNSTSFWYSFDSLTLLTDKQREKWRKIDNEIQNYKLSCG